MIIISCKKTTNSGCSFSGTAVTVPVAEADSLDTLIKDSIFRDSNIVAKKNSAGFYYTINKTGTGAAIANLCQSVSVTYKGTFFNGAGFDSTLSQPANLELRQVILGWQTGVPLITTGGDITLYLPPSLAYGSTAVLDSQGTVVIPANSYLIFRIQLLAVQ